MNQEDMAHLGHHEESNEGHEEEPKKRPFLYTILSIIFVMLLILSIVPIYSIKFDPMPKNIPTLSDVVTEFKEVNNSFEVKTQKDYYKLLNANDPFVKQVAVKVATEGCSDGLGGDRAKLCQAKAIYYFVRDNIKYISDPVFPEDDYVETAPEVLYTGGSDCDGMAILLANLEAAIGLPTRFVFVPRHVYIWVYIEDAPKKYFVDKTDNYGWIRLDATCKQCEFGVIPAENVDKEKVVV
ncbi:transglutaminase domain-containing protein [Candidatus Woesearchaeota archaeon]|jgi:hypothetical protein|nr:transglutaminase domain-containing protein [Candidatus Woesearchaeota archaeon]